ncbi:MAG: type II secretion system protein [Okeania sp. SIO2C2]|uniref:hormogonium polysaccharide secretion pseudopilin HpsC n=1 Tax=Okeania sp. SIO2C2 TaxID=2607787 RepID=UPI0013B5F435|nr:hormogonium polysaccharide secretion pseudopilin HpsC [Okeania sp. SIO2C2]NEP85417.1 type II secretion system protein [Okeania sp. SIO2C2]
MKTLLDSLLKIQYQQRRSPLSKSTGGFTMIELLVGTIIAFLITIPLLSFVVDILNRDVKEQAKASTEQEIQAAIDYIAQEMSQAVYIYTPDQVEDISNAATPAIPTDDGTPKLVFWKRKYMEDAVPLNNDDSVDCDANPNQCNDTFVFSLVAYYQIDEFNSVWCEQDPCPSSRIARVEISNNPKYLGGNYVGEEAPDNGFYEQNLGEIQNPENLIKGDGDFPARNVLVNHIEKFDVEASSNKLAKVTILGNSKSRIPGQFQDSDCETDLTSPYCPTVTAQVGSISNLGFEEEDEEE